uniref:Reverse transcriptase domain-containing protein n=1 Tax=Globodera pallida TaxID=36090 RepID=A0A183BUP8_GLOPA
MQAVSASEHVMRFREKAEVELEISGMKASITVQWVSDWKRLTNSVRAEVNALDIDPEYKVNISKSELKGAELAALERLVEKYSDIFSKSQYDLEPISSSPRRMPYKYKDELNKHIEKLIAAGKKDGGIRPCLDFRKLNEITVPDRYPLPRLDAIMEKVGRCNFYSSLDLSSGYLQIKLTEETSWKCGVITEDNVYQMLYMPFGMKNATAAFSRAMAVVLIGRYQHQKGGGQQSRLNSVR